MKNNLKSVVVFVLSLALVEVPFSLNANAGMISTVEAVSELTGVQNREKVAKFFQRQEVQKELVKFGVNSQEASIRLASLTDTEIQKMAGQIDQSPAGSDVVVISLSTILLIILILLLIRH